jgi:protein-S-isoprenylcysteine O-methyltransferase Ste14/pimeloyl-ACP methyl ester carboxylesterase
MLAFIALPGLVAFIVPLLLAWPQVRDRAFSLAGLVLLVPGIALLLWCAREFYVRGRGTLAPWDPPRHIVSSGPYRVSRNPMYIGVTLVLLGWSVVFASWAHLLYAAAAALAFHLRVVFSEEPWLDRTHHSEWTRYAARVPRWIFSSRRALLVSCAAAAIAIPIAGLVYEAYADARDARAFPAPGMMIDVGGRRLHLTCTGEGEPTVLFESSGFGNSLSSGRARDEVAARTTVCSYDRAGRGWSDAAPSVVSVADLAGDLGVLQDRASMRLPVVIVASSIGGLTAEMFARRYPERVEGLVFVDAATSLSVPFLASRDRTARALACTAGVLGHFGVMRLLDPFWLGRDTEEARRSAALTYHARAWDQLCAMARGVHLMAQQFEEAPALRPDVPLTVLSASSATDLLPPGLEGAAEEIRPGLLEAHKEFARRSTRGTWSMVPDSTHLIGESQPDAVAKAVLAMLDEIQGRSAR